MNDNAASKPTVFLSYSHKDENWKNLLQPHLKLLEQAGRISIWDDRKIDAGDKWFNNITESWTFCRSGLFNLSRLSVI